jgi:hypothetical protein
MSFTGTSNGGRSVLRMDGAPVAARSHQLEVQSLADCPYSMAQTYADEYLRAAEHHGPNGSIGLSSSFARMQIRRDVTLTFGLATNVAEYGRFNDEVRIAWRSGTRFLPDFRGVIRFRIEGMQTRILLDGNYAPPLGTFGVLFDRFIGGAVARASMQDLANRMAAYLTRREAAWRAERVAADTADSLER